MQKPHPPVWIPGGGSIETWDWCLDNDYCYCYLSYYGYKRGQEVLKGFWEVVDQRQVDPNPYRVGFLQLVGVAETDAEAEKLYAPHADYFYNRCLHVYEGFADAPGYRTIPTLRRGFKAQFGAAAAKARADLTWKDFVEQGYVIGGSPSTVREQLSEAMKTMRVGHLMVLCHFGNMPLELTKRNTELFAKEIMPHMKQMWGDYEDRWWPEPAAQRATPAPLA